MPKLKNSKRIYAAHRKNQREKILEVAEELFIQKGIEPITIANIAAASRLTRATIYKYFHNRKEIAFEIFKAIISGWHERDKREVWPDAGNGYQRIERFLTSFCNYLLRFPKETRFVAEFNYLYAREWPSRQVLKTLRQSLNEDIQFVIDSVRQGIADGSLRQDLDPYLTMATIFNLNSGLLGRLGQMGSKLQEEYSLSADKIFKEIYRIFINGIKAHPDSHKGKANGRRGGVSTRQVRSGRLNWSGHGQR